MQNKKNILCVIAARGGSRGVPGKNVRDLFGKPMIGWAIEKAIEIDEIKRVVISTDSQEIADIALKYGAEVPFLRPDNLAGSDTGKFQVWQHALKTCEEIYGTTYDLFMDIDCTNPLIETTDIVGALNSFSSLQDEGKQPDAVFTVSEARRNPYFNLVEPDEDGVLHMCKTKGDTVLARQRAPMVFEHVAGVYVLLPAYLRTASHLLDGRSFGYEIPPDKAHDVDSELDFEIIEYLLKRRMSC